MAYEKNEDGEIVLPCPICNGEGQIEVSDTSRCCVNPHECCGGCSHMEPCPNEDCRDGYVRVECEGCGLSPVEDGEEIDGMIFCRQHGCADEAHAASVEAA